MSATDRTWLLVFPDTKELVPLHPAALTRAQASRHELAHAYRGALVLSPDGLRRVEGINVLGPYGASFGRRLLSRLTHGWRISVHLSEPLSWTLDELKRLLTDCLEHQTHQADREAGGANSLQEVRAAVEKATGIQAVLDAMGLPPPDEALDVL